MIETYDLLLTYGIFAVFAYANQITSTLWLDYGDDSLAAALKAGNGYAWINVFIHFARTAMSIVLLGVGAHYTFVKGTDVGTQAGFMRPLFTLYCFAVANSIRLTLTKFTAVLLGDEYDEEKRPRMKNKDGSQSRQTYYKTPFASLASSQIFAIENAQTNTDKVKIQFAESVLESVSVFTTAGALVAYCFAIQGKFYATVNGTNDRIWTDWLIMVCGVTGVVGLVLFYFSLYRTVRSFVAVKAGKGIIAYDVSLPHWFQYLMTVVTISTFTVFYGDYGRIFMVYVLFIGVVYGQIGWKRDPDAWYEAHTTAITTLCEFTYYPILFKIADWNVAGVTDMLPDGTGSMFMQDWDYPPLRVQYMVSAWFKVSLSIAAVISLVFGVYSAWHNEDFTNKRLGLNLFGKKDKD
jgi:hypothetical protein